MKNVYFVLFFFVMWWNEKLYNSCVLAKYGCQNLKSYHIFEMNWYHWQLFQSFYQFSFSSIKHQKLFPLFKTEITQRHNRFHIRKRNKFHLQTISTVSSNFLIIFIFRNNLKLSLSFNLWIVHQFLPLKNYPHLREPRINLFNLVFLWTLLKSEPIKILELKLVLGAFSRKPGRIW